VKFFGIGMGSINHQSDAAGNEQFLEALPIQSAAPHRKARMLR